MSTLGLASKLPPPRRSAQSTKDSDDDEQDTASAGPSSSARIASRIDSSSAVAARGAKIPVYGQRTGWRPSSLADFGDGGSFPECHIAQYPLDMGRVGAKRGARSGGSLALQLDEEGNVRYDALVQQGRRSGELVQSTHRDLVPLSQRSDFASDSRTERPTGEEVAETTERTRRALEAITQTKIKATKVANLPTSQASSSFVRYTPGAAGSSGSQRIIKMTEVAEDPLEPSRFKHKKGGRPPPSPPPPVLRSPPRKATAAELKEWVIPPSISNWKNTQGFTVSLDQRLASDGRGLQEHYINDGFAQFSEALNLADRHAREEVRQRAAMQAKLAEKERANEEDRLRMLAQRAREERAGVATPSFAGDTTTGSEVGDSAGRGKVAATMSKASMPAALAGYGSDSGEDDSDSEDEQAARERDRIREERRREREREMRMSAMGNEQRAKMLAKEQNRDISEKIALGLAKPTGQGGELDARLFGRETFSASFGGDDEYNMYDKPLLTGSSAAHAIYGSRPRPAGGAGTSDDIYAGGTEDGIDEALKNDRFGLGKSKFEGAENAEARTGPVQFEKDSTTTADPFAIGQFLDDAKRGTKRVGIQYTGDEARKRAREEDT